MEKKCLIDYVRLLPGRPGVYLFKSDEDEIIYIGKAKNLKKRVSNYFQSIKISSDVKAGLIVQSSSKIDFIETETELAAMILEAQLIQQHQPKFNILLKTGQPFVFIFVSSGSVPEMKIVRTKNQKGVYFGPFIEKGHARRVYDFLIKTFRLKLCKKKIEQGCLNYHMGLCAGSCRPDFNQDEYIERMNLAKTSLKQGHAKFLKYLKEEIDKNNKNEAFEKSKELYSYYKAFSSIFSSLEAKNLLHKNIGNRDIWILTKDRTFLYVFGEMGGVLKKKHVFCFSFINDVDKELKILVIEYMQGFYRTTQPASEIIINIEFLEEDCRLFEIFLKTWHKLDNDVSISMPTSGHGAALLRLGCLYADQEEKKRQTLGKMLKNFLSLSFEPKTIDCFDISHKQGMFMVGSCIRFENGQPDKKNFRKFHIKTVHQIDDYASLREIVSRRYKNQSELPDLILIDGGKGQLNAVQDLFDNCEFAALAKREEIIFSRRFTDGKKIDPKSIVGQVLIAIRDYTHHFAITFHRSLESL